MKNLFFDELYIFETTEAIYNDRLTESIVEYSELLSDKHYVTESEHKALIVKIKEFFAKIITSLKTFHDNIKIKLNKFVKENTLEIKLRNLKKELIDRNNSGEKYIKTIDLIKYKNTYIKMVKDLWKYAQNFEKVNYKSVEQIDHDLEKFNKTIERYNNELDEIEKKEYRMKTIDVIDFVSREIDGSSDVLRTINDSINKVKEMQAYAENLKIKRDVLGNDVIPKHVFFLKRICNSITSFIRKRVAKFISVIVLLFA